MLRGLATWSMSVRPSSAGFFFIYHTTCHYSIHCHCHKNLKSCIYVNITPPALCLERIISKSCFCDRWPCLRMELQSHSTRNCVLAVITSPNQRSGWLQRRPLGCMCFILESVQATLFIGSPSLLVHIMTHCMMSDSAGRGRATRWRR